MMTGTWGEGLLRHAAWICVVAGLVFWGCDDGSQTALPPQTDGGAGASGGSGGNAGTAGGGGTAGAGGSGGQAGQGGQGGEGGAAGGGGQGGAAGGGGEGGGAGSGGMGGGGGVEPVDAPEFRHVAVATVEGSSYVAWYADGQLRVRELSADGSWAADAELIAELAEPPAGVAAVEAAQIPWIAWSDGESGPIHVVQADRVASGVIDLGIFGRPVLSAAGDDRLVVFGRDAEDRLDWQYVNADGTVDGDPVNAGLDLPSPDSAASIGGPVIARVSGPGQCIYIEEDGTATGSFPCLNGVGQLIGNGEDAFVTYISTHLGIERLAVLPVFGPSNQTAFNTGQAGQTEGIAYPASGSSRPAFVLSEEVGGNQGLVEMVFIEMGGLWRSIDHWNRLPFADARALARHGDNGLVVRFNAGSPSVEVVPLVEHDFGQGNQPYDFEREVDCRQPQLEDCTDADKDCDGRPHNGLCCSAPDEGAAFRWVLDGAPENPEDFQILATDVQDRNAIRFMVRTREDHWEGHDWRFGAQNFVGIPEFHIDGAYKGHMLLATGGSTTLLADDADGNIKVFFYFDPDRLELLRPDFVLEGCDRVLDARQLRFDDQQWSAVVACPNKLFIIFPAIARDNIPLNLPEMPEAGATWATIGKNGDRSLTILLGYEVPGVGWKVQLWNADSRGFTADHDLPGALLNAGDELENPIWYQFNGRAHVQELPNNRARALVRTGANWEWRDIVTTSSPEEVQVAPELQQVIVRGEVDAETDGFWIVHAKGDPDFGVNLWSAQPSFTLPKYPGLIWTATRGEYFGNSDPRPSFFAFYPDPDDAERNRWVIRAPQIDCYDL